MFEKYSADVYADLILANLGPTEKKDNAEITEPKLLVGITHRLGGAKSWDSLEKIATFTSKENPVPEFKKIQERYSLRFGKMDDLILNLFLKAGWRHRKKTGLVVEKTSRAIDKKTILDVIGAKGIYLDTIYVHFGEDSYQVLSYCPFSIRDEDNCHTGAAYSAKVYNWKNTKESQKTLMDMLKKENNA
jgi:hypothetical protein